MKTFKFEVTMKVADMWIEDGFGALNRKAKKALEENIAEVLKENLIPWAHGYEFKVSVKTVLAPDMEVIAKLQGYEK